MENNLLMFYTGGVRSASSILQEQRKNITSGMQEENQLRICEQARKLKEEFSARAEADSFFSTFVRKNRLPCARLFPTLNS